MSLAVAAAQPASSYSTAQPCPLHACLLRYGITDLAAFSVPRHLALSQEEVDSTVEPKLPMLAAEALSPKQVQLARMVLAKPQLLRFSATTLAAKLAALEDVLDSDAAAALQLAVVQPVLLSLDIRARLPPLLRFLDTYMGEAGAGRRLVLAQPVVGAVSATAAERSIGSLSARGYSQQRIQGIISKQPSILTLNLDSPLQRQKLDWIERVSPWTLDDFLDKPQYIGTKTRRLAARLALLQKCGLQPSPTAATLATTSDARFMKSLDKQLVRQGQGLPWASWAEWEEAWLGTEEGREWGFPPIKE
ncbi:hypothetical protein N2152v2_009974 [Parachlorella kessleri]